MSSTPSTTDQNDQAIAIKLNVQYPSSQENRHLAAVTSTTPILPDQILTEEQHEDIMIQQINELIRGFLRLPIRRNPYRGLFQWTLEGDATADYSVVMLISEPADLVF
jgi:hypothetical protein